MLLTSVFFLCQCCTIFVYFSTAFALDSNPTLPYNNKKKSTKKKLVAQYDQHRLQTAAADQHQLQQLHHQQQQHHLLSHDSSSAQTKAEEIVLLEKQGRCSQKQRHSNAGAASAIAIGNLAQVSHTVGQNMADISNIGGGGGGGGAGAAGGSSATIGGTKKVRRIYRNRREKKTVFVFLYVYCDNFGRVRDLQERYRQKEIIACDI